MAVLAKDEIIKAIDAGDIQITPFHRENIGCASNEFRYYKPGLQVLDVVENTNYKDITEYVTLGEGESFLLLPGQACLGITIERIHLAPGYCGLLEGRSRFARLGLFVHITAGFMNPGINNRQVLEIYNASNHPLRLWPGTKICQFVFLKMIGNGTYSGIFQENSLK